MFKWYDIIVHLQVGSLKGGNTMRGIVKRLLGWRKSIQDNNPYKRSVKYVHVTEPKAKDEYVSE